MEDVKKINLEIEEKKKQSMDPVKNNKSETAFSEIGETRTEIDSPLLDATTRDKLVNLGQSLDAK